jgi:hypothetical protein
MLYIMEKVVYRDCVMVSIPILYLEDPGSSLGLGNGQLFCQYFLASKKSGILYTTVFRGARTIYMTIHDFIFLLLTFLQIPHCDI